MDADDIARAIDRTFAAYSAGDLDGFLANFAADLAYDDNARTEPLHGREAFRTYVEGWLEASSDGTITPVRKIISGDQAAAVLRFECTHDLAPLYGVAATGARITFDFTILVRVADGQINCLDAFYNPFSVMQPLGLLGDLPTGPR